MFQSSTLFVLIGAMRFSAPSGICNGRMRAICMVLGFVYK
ncbi:hypothetical protein SZ55_4789 [Pseudomonas sp. FeS53a]|nr:hypothetical protein SZ55_4789 [Pseudomonas sp. FeS53a]